MRKVILSAALLLTLLLPTSAQVTMEIVLDQDQYLRSETVTVRVRIMNSSGRTLRLGTDPNWLTFKVDGEGGVPLARLEPGPVTRAFDLESSKTVTLRTDLVPFFNLSEVGHYTVTAKAKVPELNLEVEVRPKTFDITQGVKLWEREFGVPATTPPESRKFALQQATFLKERMRLYTRVTDLSESRVFRVQYLGPLVSFSKPETLLDPSSNLHVLFQVGARSFSYCVVNPGGELIIRQIFEQSATRPTLRATEDGRCTVAGGERLVLPTDLPPPVVSTNAIPAPK